MNKQDQTLGRKVGVIVSAFLLVATTALFINSAPALGQGQDAPGDEVQITGAVKNVKSGSANHIALITVFNSAGTPIIECHGALISPTYVLGSSSCADTPGAARTLITLGASNVSKPKKWDFENRSAVSTVTHPMAGDATWGSYAYEMALFKLSKASTRRPLILGANSLTADSKSGVLQGYGPSTTRGNDGGILRQGKVSFSSRARTIDIFGRASIPTSGAPFADMILSEGASSSHVKSCDDPGAPVITNVKGKPTLLALASRQFIYQGFGICNDAADEYFHVYFNVTSPQNAKWIKDVVGKTGPAKDAKCAGKWATIFGTNGADTMFGTAGSDVMFGFKGNDILNGGAGKDRVCGSGGADVLIGGAGKDICDGGKQKDRAKQCEKKKKL